MLDFDVAPDARLTPPSQPPHSPQRPRAPRSLQPSHLSIPRTLPAPGPTSLNWRSVLVHGCSTRYAVAGAGDPVVLVHGLSGSTRWWQRNLPVLAGRRRVYLVDLPGFGGMSRWRGRFALAEAADWLHTWMRAVGLRCADLVGHSMGGYICVQLAARHPDAVVRLALVDPAGIPSGRGLIGTALPLVEALAHTTPAFYPTLVLDGMRAGPTTVLRAASEILRGDVRALLHRVRAPTLLIWGRHDTLVPATNGVLLREALPDARLLVLDGAGHVAMFDRPHAFNSALLRFLHGEDVGV
jgi:pimeloyl-ACP methyl ester carboxylesterase